MATVSSRNISYLDSPQERLHDTVMSEIKRSWTRPLPAPARYARPVEDTTSLANAVLDAMLVRAFRVTPFPPPDEYSVLLSRVQYWVRRGRPIHVMLGYGPLKNPKTVSHTRADWAEFFALGHLAAWHNKVASIYPPGLRIKIVFDDSTIRMANRYAYAPMNDYIRSVGELIKAMRYEEFIVGTMRQSTFAWLFYFGMYQLAEWRVRRWERAPQNNAMLRQMELYAGRNVMPPPGLSDAAQEQFYRDAAHRYRVYWEALQLSGLSRLGHKIVAMYLDGHQHHLRQPAAIHLTSVAKGQVTQPWQGEGALRDNGYGQLVPTVLTRKRRAEFDIQRIPFPGFSCPGFESIPVCRERCCKPAHFETASPIELRGTSVF